MTNLLKVQTVWSGIEGAPYYSTMHFGAGADEVESQEAADAMTSFWNICEPIIRSGLTWEITPEVLVFNDVDGALVRADVIVGGFGAGTNVGEILPRAASGLVRWSTGVVVGRRFLRGRTFIPLPTETNNDVLGVPTAGYKTTLQSAIDNLLGDITVAPYIWSRPQKDAEGNITRDGDSAPIQSGTVWDEWAYLRSRRD